MHRDKPVKHWDTHLMYDENEDGKEVTHGVSYVEQAVNEIVDWPELLAADDDEARAFKECVYMRLKYVPCPI